MEVRPGDPDAVVVKRATGPGAVALRAEGERLRAAAHPGVVEVLESTGSADAWELRLAHAGRPLDVAGPLATLQVASLTAAIAATLADLHEGGIVHGRVDAGHVLLSRQGRPVLCGFGPSTHAQPADDVAALGALLAELLGSGVDIEPIPERRWRWRSWSGWDRRTLLLLADQACADPPTRRPTARRLAAALAAAVPEAGIAAPGPAPLPSPPGGDAIEALRASATEPVATARPRLRLLAGAAAVVLLVAVGGVRTLGAGSSPAMPAVAPASTTATAVTALRATPTTDLPPTTTGPAAAAPVPCVVLPGTTPGACAPVRVVGTTVQAGATRYELGQPGDEVVLGDWDCDGAATPALLRPSTGDVFVFQSWTADRELVVPAVAHVAGAHRLDVVPGPGPCTGLVAGTPAGPVRVDVGTAT